MVHNGFEWNSTEKHSFLKEIRKLKLIDKFEKSYIGEHDDDSNIWKFFISEQFYQECLEICKELMLGFENLLFHEKHGSIQFTQKEEFFELFF